MANVPVTLTASTPAELVDPELRGRACRQQAAATRQYRAMEGDSEVGYVAVDVYRGEDFFCLYEIVLPRRLRGQGMGRRIMEAVERLAGDQGYGWVTLRASPLDSRDGEGRIDEERLGRWYERQGYIRDPEDYWCFTKRL